MEFEFLEHTADVKFRAYGKTLNEAFENAGKAMFDVMVEIEKIETKEARSFSVESEDLKALLYDFIEELLISHDMENMVFSKFNLEIKKDQEYYLEGKCFGERLDRNKHNIKTGVKAVTYHDMKIHQEENNYWVEVVLDV